MLVDFPSKNIFGLLATNSETENPNKRRHTDKTLESENCTITEENQWYTIGHYCTCGYKFEVDHNKRKCRQTHLNKKKPKKKEHGKTRWKAARIAKTTIWTNDGVGRSGKNIVLKY